MAATVVMVLCDTNILIEFYKNNPAIVGELRSIGVLHITISVITQAELYAGALNRNELTKIKKHLVQLQLLPIDRATSQKFIQLMELHSLSHKLSIPDALIAATASIHDVALYTLNIKDFRYIDNLNLYQPQTY